MSNKVSRQTIYMSEPLPLRYYLDSSLLDPMQNCSSTAKRFQLFKLHIRLEEGRNAWRGKKQRSKVDIAERRGPLKLV